MNQCAHERYMEFSNNDTIVSGKRFKHCNLYSVSPPLSYHLKLSDMS